MTLSDSQREFLLANHAAAMITVGTHGMPKAVRVGVALVDGQLWSSGTVSRVRTNRLRGDPRCSLFVFGEGYQTLTLETRVTILEGEAAPDLNLRLFRVMQGRPHGDLMWYGEELDTESFRQRMAEEDRLIYQFEIEKAYGLD